MTSMPVGVGVIGCGRRVRKLLGWLAKVGGEDGASRLRVRGLVDPDEQALLATRALIAPWQREVVPVFSSPEALCAAPGVDWIWVGSWNHLHRAHAEVAFEFGRHVFLEKPLATSLPDAVRVVEAQARAGTSLALDFPLRFSPLYRRLVSLLHAGRIGTLVSVELTEVLSWAHGRHMVESWRADRQKAGSLLLEKSIHELDLLAWLTGSPVQEGVCLQGRGVFPSEERAREEAFPDHLAAVMRTRSGVLATLRTVLGAGLPERRVVLHGTLGTLRAEYMTGELVLGVPEVAEPQVLERGIDPSGDRLLVEALVYAMLGQASFPVGLAEGLEAMRVAHLLDPAASEA